MCLTVTQRLIIFNEQFAKSFAAHYKFSGVQPIFAMNSRHTLRPVLPLSALVCVLNLFCGAAFAQNPPNSGEFSSGGSAAAQLLDLSWNQVLLYPQGGKPGELQYAAALVLPEGWKYGTALTLAGQNGAGLHFAPVSLETLVDLLGEILKPLTPDPGPP